MEKFVEQTLLYDFYGELLNEHQRGIYQDIVFNDLSLSEVADEYGISRQGVHDLIKRVNNTLNGYEEKVESGTDKNNFTENAFRADDGIFYLGKNRDGVHREETFATAKVDVTNQMKTDKKWFADTTNVLNVFKNDAAIQSADTENGSMAVNGNTVDAQPETTTEEKLNKESKNNTNVNSYSQNGESSGYHTDRN